MSDEQVETITYECYNCSNTTTNNPNDMGWGEYDEHWYCDNCYNTCGRCGDFMGDDGYYIDDVCETWCEDCRSNGANWCDSCEQYLSNHRHGTHQAYDSDMWYCDTCANDNWNFCSDCEQYWIDECNCGDRAPEHIHSYNHKPDPIFRSSDDSATTQATGLWLGVEIECEIWSGDVREASELSAGLDDYFYLKNDSSIQAPGFEIVSHPYSFEYWHAPDNKMMNFVERIRTEYKARSWDSRKSSLGLHIHISRTGFTSGAHAHRFLALIYDNSKQMSLLGGRKGSSYAKFSDIYKFDDYGKPYKAIYEKLHQARNTDRYSAVNTLNLHTIELRWFRGTMARAGILSAIQLAHASVEYTRYLTVANVRDGALRWDKFSAYILENRETYPDIAGKIDRLSAINLNNLPELLA
jgi:hypothetical protein